MASIESRFAPLLAEREAQHLKRQRPLSLSAQQPQMQINGLDVINFCSNDYLGLANHPDIKRTLIETAEQNKTSYGSGAAHLVTGHHLDHHLLEDELADWLGLERTLLFSTGYMANLAVLQTFMQKGDVILADKLNHASLIDGAKLSDAEMKRYPHLDMDALERRLIQAHDQQQQALIVTDGVFSMDGDIAPLKDLQKLAKKHQAWLFIDDAHGIGTLGHKGKGCFEHFGLEPDQNTIIVGTLGKAFGCSGAFVAGSQIVIESLINFGRPYIYTTASSPFNAAAVRCALKLVQTGQDLRQKLEQNIDHFRQGATQIGLDLWPSQTAIQPILLGESETALKWSEHLKQHGLWVAAIRPPTVPQSQARLRITLSASHTTKQIDQLLTGLKQLQTCSSLQKN